MLADFQMPESDRQKLRQMMAAHQYTDIATITKDGISGNHEYGDLREMHSGHGVVCHGAVDRSAWTDRIKEVALVYCVGETCVAVPTICNNVSLVTRRAEQQAAMANEPEITEPLLFEPPAAGMPVSETPAPVVFAAAPMAQAADAPLGGESFGGIVPAGLVNAAAPAGSLPGTAVVVSAVPEASNWLMMLAGLIVFAGGKTFRKNKN